MNNGSSDGPLRRITGVAGLLRGLRNLHLLGHVPSHDRNLQHFEADDGQAIPVRVLGSGDPPPIVLVHGLGCSHRHWMPVARRLGKRHRVLAWDARGHGHCQPLPDRPITLARLGGDLAQMLDHFALERAALVGHSMGALAVLRYLQDHGTGRVAAVMLVDQSPRIVTDDDWRLGMFGSCSAPMLLGLIAGARRNLVDTVLHEVEGASGEWLRRRLAPDATLGRWLRRWLGHVDASALLDLAESLALADFRPLLPRLDVPLCVVLGARSAHYRGLALDAYYRQAVPHAAVAIYERAGHSPHVSEPARFADQLLAFLEDHL
jgi:pimeloyl-ACP methyl ester carboxylesterase